MTVQFSVAVRNARLDAIETAIGASPHLHIYTGSVPASCATAASGTKIVDMTLPADFYANAASGSKALAGTWQSTGINGGGTAGYYRILASDNATVHEQGTVTITGGGGDLTVDNTSIANGQTVTITGMTKTDGNA